MTDQKGPMQKLELHALGELVGDTEHARAYICSQWPQEALPPLSTLSRCGLVPTAPALFLLLLDVQRIQERTRLPLPNGNIWHSCSQAPLILKETKALYNLL